MLTDLADLVLSRACIGCEQPGPVVCIDCWERAAEPRAHPVALAAVPPVLVGARYEGLARDAVSALKERGVLSMADALGGWLAIAIADVPALRDGSPCVLVPIPPHRRSVTVRGVDTLDRIARRAAAMLRHAERPVRVEPLLRRTVDRGRQVGLGARERRDAVAGSMAMRWPLLGADGRRSIDAPSDQALAIVVDDVVTTGATAVEAVRALRAGGIEAAAVAAACGTPRSAQPGEPRLHALDHRVDP